MGYKCNDCEEEFSCIGDLGIHLMSDGWGEYINEGTDYETFRCVQCDAEYEDEGDLYMHMIFGEGLGSLTGEDKLQQEEFERNPPEEFKPLFEAIEEQRQKDLKELERLKKIVAEKLKE